MARIQGKDVQDAICRAFNLEPKDLTPAQIFTLVKIIKHCRLRCRNNSALNNWLKAGFPALDITTIKVPSKYPKYAGETYDALKIINPERAQTDVPVVEQQDEDE